MQTTVALLLVAVAAVSASTFSEMVIRQKRTSGGSPLGALSGVPVVGGVVGTVGAGAGGLLGAGVGATGSNNQAAECAQTDCGQTACTAQSNTNNNANGQGGLIGAGSLVGPVNVNAPVCPGICAQCNQLGLATLGK